MENKRKNSSPKKKIKLSIIGVLLSLLFTGMNISLVVLLNTLNIIPDKYYKLLIICLILINIILNFFLSLKFKNKVLKVFKVLSYIFSIILIILFTIGIIYLNKTMNLFDNISIIKEEVTNYYLIVLNDSNYQEASDLYGKTMAYFELTDKEVINRIKLDLTYSEEKDLLTLKSKLLNKEVESILISDIIKNRYEEDDETFNQNTRILKTIYIKKEIEDITKRVSIKNTPYNILISGTDTFGDINNAARNDVNIVATVNPNTNEILLTSIPRDYYVQLHDKPGYKDKLTHASYYGINTAIKTIEDIFDIDINYYIKVNFTTVIDLVNKIGGIEVYADQAVSLYGCPRIKVGINKLNGACALAFSRERYSYSDGDRHRGRNQQEVIQAIFKKLSSGTTIFTQYIDILDALEGKFATNMDMNEITNFLKYEFSELNDYTFKSIQVDGTGSMGKTYSYPNQDLWIMIPDQKTIDNAKIQINKVLNNESIK